MNLKRTIVSFLHYLVTVSSCLSLNLNGKFGCCGVTLSPCLEHFHLDTTLVLSAKGLLQVLQSTTWNSLYSRRILPENSTSLAGFVDGDLVVSLCSANNGTVFLTQLNLSNNSTQSLNIPNLKGKGTCIFSLAILV